MSGPVLLLAPATSYRIEPFARAAERLGIALVLGTDVPAAARRHDLPTYRVDFADPARSAAAFGDRRFSGLCAADEPSAWLAAHIAEKGLAKEPYHRSSGVQAARDKRLMRERLSAAGVPVPRYRVFGAGQGVTSRGFPCVVKPPMLSGSQGVIRADDDDSLRRVAARVRAVLASHPSPLRAEEGFFDLIVEDYVDGPEVAVEAIVRRGEMLVLVLFDKPEPMTGPFFEETLYVAPSRKSAELQARIVQTAAEAAAALELCDGPIHAELRVHGDRPVLIEIAARSIGGLCSRALSRRIGSLEERLLLAAAGMPNPPLREEAPAIGVMMIPVPKSGVLAGVHGLDRARAVAGIDGIEIAVAAGEPLRALPEGNRYLGFIFAHGVEAADAEEALRRACAELSFELKPLLPVVG